jgi:hypothetical protein
MDSDALFTDMSLEIPFEKYAGYDLVYTGNKKSVSLALLLI